MQAWKPVIVIHTSWSHDGMIARGKGGIFTLLDNFSMQHSDFAILHRHCEISQSITVLPDFALLLGSIAKFCNASQERREITESKKNRKFDFDLRDMTSIRKLIVLGP